MSANSSKKNKPFVVKFANIEDAATGDAFEEFHFSKTLGRRGKLRIERDKAQDSKALMAALLRKNAVLPASEEDAEKMVAGAINSEPMRHRPHVRHLGWLPGRHGFALKKKVLGAPKGPQKLRPPLWLNDRQVGSLKSQGTLKDWQKHIALPALHSTRLMLVLAATFAAPLVAVSGLQNFGLNIFGRSKVGKTTALLVGASAMGIGTERELPNWNSTDSSFLETARGFNDLMLPANEVGLLVGKRRDAYGPIRGRIYAFSEGRDRARLSNSTMAATWASSAWRGIFVSTAEYSFNDYAAFSGEARSAGEYARCLDVAATEKRHATVFDSYPPSLSKVGRKRWARRMLTELRANCAKFHGSALEPYLVHLMKASAELPKRVEVHCGKFMKEVRAMRLDGALKHAGRNFALLYAGGCIAIEAKILPWTGDHLFSAIRACFEAAVKDIRGHSNALGRARKILRQKLRSKDIVESRSGVKMMPGRHAGYWETEEGIRSFTIHAKAFRRWFDSPAQMIAILHRLHQEGLLLAGKGKFVPSLKSGQWAERACRWPGGTIVKSVRLQDPFPATKA